LSQTEAFKVYPMCKGYIHFWLVPPLHVNFTFLFMSTLANESLLETFYEEALEELDVKNDSPFYADACKIAEQMAMDRLLSY